MKKRILILITLSSYILFTSCTKSREGNKKEFYLAVVSIVEIDPIIELREGFLSVFNNSRFAESHRIRIKEFNTQNDARLANLIVDKLSIDRPDMIYVLGTPVAQAIQQRLPDVLLVQGTATDPVAAGLADSWEGSGKKYIATTDLPPIEKQIELIMTITPGVKRLGIIYNPGEINSTSVISRLREYLKSFPVMRLVERPIANSSEVARAVQTLIGNADAIYLPPDNTAYAAIPVIGKFATDRKIPFYATVESAIKEGAVATLSLDFRAMGGETAKLALRVLAGEDPGKIPIKFSESPVVFVNEKVATELGVDLKKLINVPNLKIVK